MRGMNECFKRFQNIAFTAASRVRGPRAPSFLFTFTASHLPGTGVTQGHATQRSHEPAWRPNTATMTSATLITLLLASSSAAARTCTGHARTLVSSSICMAPTPRRQTPSVCASAAMGDEPESELLQQLTRSYYKAAGQQGSSVYNAHSSLHARRAKLLGLYADIPLVEARFPLLPYSQTVLNVSQHAMELGDYDATLEEWKALFETLIQRQQPWLYVHTYQPTAAGTATDAEALASASSEPQVGTLMRVVATERDSYGRLQLLVQGLGRMRILKTTPVRTAEGGVYTRSFLVRA